MTLTINTLDGKSHRVEGLSEKLAVEKIKKKIEGALNENS